MSRVLTDHIVEDGGSPLRIAVVDNPGAGGANHEYLITKPDDGDDGLLMGLVKFQNGPIKEVGVNGVTHEALLAILIDRLRSFQTGPFKGRENAIALAHLEDALMWLQARTRERLRRGVEGTSQQ